VKVEYWAKEPEFGTIPIEVIAAVLDQRPAMNPK
jgi:hypothetical protein